MNSAISFIIPVYNNEMYIERCYQSIINQNIEYEIIFIDDGSTDESKNIIKKIKNKDRHVIAVFQKNSGPYLARIRGLKLAKMKYIMFVDSDDYLEANTLKNLIKYFDYDKNIDCVMFDVVKEFKNDSPKNRILDTRLKSKVYNKVEIKKEICPLLFSNNIVCSLCNKIIKRELIDFSKIKRHTLKYGEDGLFFMKIIENFNKLYYENKVIYHYCDNGESTLTKKHDNNYIENVLIPLYKEKDSYGKKWGYENLSKIEFTYLYISEIIKFNFFKRIICEKNRYTLSQLSNIKLNKIYSPVNNINLKFKIAIIICCIISKIKIRA